MSETLNNLSRNLRNAFILSMSLTLAACGGGGSSQVPPEVISFTASDTLITLNETVEITPEFNGSTGSIEFIGEVESGVAIQVTPSVTTTYTLTVSSPGFSEASQFVTVRVVDAPEITSLTAAATTITAGNSTTITPVFNAGGGSATVDNTDTVTIATSGSLGGPVSPPSDVLTSGTAFTVNPTVTTIYTVTVTNAAGVSVTDSITINVLPAPTAGLIATPSVVTQGSTVSLAATLSNGTGSINNGIGTVTNGSNTNVTPANTTTYTLTTTNSIGDRASDTATVTVVSAPTITSFTADSTTITAGSSANLTAVFAGGTGSINNSVGSVSSGVTKTVSPASTTSYLLTVTNAAGDRVTQNLTITVIAAPSITSFVSSQNAFGDNLTTGKTVNLTATFTGGTGTIDNGIGAVTSGAAATTAVLTGNQTYILTVTNAVGATATATVNITVVAAPAITSFTSDAAVTNTITNGNSTNLNAVFSNGSGSIDQSVGAVTSGIDKSVSPTADTTYLLTVTNAAGDSVTQNLTITVVAAPEITSFTSDAPVITNTITNSDSVNITAVFTGGTGSIDQTIGGVTSGANTSVSPTTDTTYQLTVTNTAGNSVTRNLTITVLAQPTANLATTDADGIVDLTNPGVSNAFDLLPTYSIPGGGGSASIDQTIGLVASGGSYGVTINSTTTYTLTVTNSAGFSKTASKTMTVAPPGVLIIVGSVVAIPDTATIELVFDRAMAPGTLNITGDLAAEDDGGAWTLSDQYLTISPSSTWTPGIGRTITVNAADTFGNPIDALTLTYDIADGNVIFVSTGGDNTDGSTPAKAFTTIAGAIAVSGGTDIVAVNEGTYTAATPVNLISGVKLLGGYKSDFSDRGWSNFITYETVLTDTSNTATGDATAPHTAIKANGSITSATLVQGLTVNGSAGVSADHTAGIWISGGATPTIERNRIAGGSGSTTSYGLYIDSSNPEIRNNMIFGGSSPASYGINLNTSDATVRNNTVSGGSGATTATAIDGANSNALVDNNIMFANGGGTNTCFADDGNLPGSLNNNDLFCTVVYYDNAAGCAGGTNCTLVETNALGIASSNVSVDPVLSEIDGVDNDITTLGDNDWTLSVGTPVSVSAGGLNGIDNTWGFTDDMNGVTRPASTNPWSMGAFEP